MDSDPTAGNGVGELLTGLATALDAEDVALLTGASGHELTVEAVAVNGNEGARVVLPPDSHMELVHGSLFDRAFTGYCAVVGRTSGGSGDIREGARVALAAPIRLHGDTIGLLYATVDSQPGESLRRAIMTVEAFAERATACVGNSY